MRQLSTLTTTFFAALSFACGGGGGGGSEALSVKAEVVSTEVAFPVDLAAAPDGRIFFTELRSGRVRILESGVILTEPFARLDVPAVGVEGLLGIALDRDFSANGFVYVFSTVDRPLRNRVVRFRAEGNRGVEPSVVIDYLPNGGHNGGKIAAAADGTIFISTGDAGDPALSQDMASLAGKILRINRDGSIPGDNPFPGSPIYALGFRNVFGLAIDPRTGKLFASENGPDCDDEINLISAGGNYGWRPGQPCGDTDPAFIQPLERLTPSIGVTGITFYRSGELSELENELLIGDINTGTIRRYLLDANDGTPLAASILFPGDPAGALGITTGADGLIYFTTQNAILRLVREAGADESLAAVSD